MNKKKTLLQKFTEFNAAKRLANGKKTTLLTVSGGMDSIVMCHLFKQAGFPFAIAHCNFQLRGAEADGDEQFVTDLAKQYGVKLFVKKFNTKQYAEEKSLSIQLAARELRYNWFEEIRKENGFNLIATAHHLNDNIETILYNFTKGTGIRGLRGIPVRQVNIVRPLLFASREEIVAHMKGKKLQFREDSSNSEDKYTRNKIRHNIIPLLKEINPSLEQTLGEKIEQLNEVEQLYEKQTAKASRQLFLPRGNDIYIPLLKLRKTGNAGSVLFEYLKDYGFNSEQVEDILNARDAESGKQFLSNEARIIKDRRFFILTKLKEQNNSVQFINEDTPELTLGERKLQISEHTGPVTADKNIAYLDRSKLEFPLIARKWAPGDYFYPFGMKMKKKKLKKFFIDEKVPLHEKENVWVIESNKKIVWVVGFRIDERFKVGEKTGQIAKIKLS